MAGSGERHTGSACDLAYRYASNPSEAEDIAQDALLRAWRRRSTLREADRRNQWLATIVRNEAFRQHARGPPRSDRPTIELLRGGRGREGAGGGRAGRPARGAGAA